MGELLLPAWPKEEDYPYNVLGDGEFDHDLAAAYAARLRVAVEALENINASANGPSAIPGHPTYNPWGIANYCIEQAGAAMDTIGDLPPLPELPTGTGE